jgi:hypothetical protein
MMRVENMLRFVLSMKMRSRCVEKTTRMVKSANETFEQWGGNNSHFKLSMSAV